jgi:hypothetical protein
MFVVSTCILVLTVEMDMKGEKLDEDLMARRHKFESRRK